MEFKLRTWLDDDADNLARYANNANVAKWLTDKFPHPYTEQDARDFLSFAVKETNTLFAIEVEGSAVGSIGVYLQTDIHMKSAELGYWLAEEFWGRGILSRAIPEVGVKVFGKFDINRIYARPFSSNAGSQRVLEKAGFTLEARLKNAIYKNGEFLNELIYTKFRE